MKSEPTANKNTTRKDVNIDKTLMRLENPIY